MSTATPRQRGRTIRDPSGPAKRIVIYLPPEHMAAVRRVQEEQGCTQSEAVKHIIDVYNAKAPHSNE